MNTTYGRLVLAKIGLFVLVIAVAAYSRHLVRTRVAASRPAPVRRAIWAELAITAIVLGVSATLVQTTPARSVSTDVSAADSGYFNTTATSSLYSMQIEVSPARRGNNSVHLYAYTLDNQPLPVVEWQVTVALPAAGIEPIQVPATAHRQPRHRRDQSARRGRLGAAGDRPYHRDRPGHGDRHRTRPIERFHRCSVTGVSPPPLPP